MVMVLISCKPGNDLQGGRMDVSGACAFLWSQQQFDGSWRSTEHRIMGEGHVLTSFILYHMNLLPDSLTQPYQSKFNKGLDYLRSELDAYGRLGFADPDIMEYPNYANAYALMLFHHVNNPQDQKRIKQLQQYLAAQQFIEHRGVTPENLAYGGWGFGERLAYGAHGQVDLSHSRRALQALKVSGYPMEQLGTPVRRFLSLLQKQPNTRHLQPIDPDKAALMPFDGGFYYSPVVLGANKAHTDSLGYFISYPTATADGLLALCILDAQATEITDAWNYLNAETDLWDWHLEGAPHWSQAMRYYHLMVRSEVLVQMGSDTYWDLQVVDWLGTQQLPNGSFINKQGMISKEDEPLLTTTMALFTWLNCQLADKNPSV